MKTLERRKRNITALYSLAVVLLCLNIFSGVGCFVVEKYALLNNIQVDYLKGMFHASVAYGFILVGLAFEIRRLFAIVRLAGETKQ